MDVTLIGLPAGSDEARLAALLRRADPRALDAIYAQHGPAVFGYLRATLHPRADAEDVFQQVMTEVWRRGAQYDPSRGSMLTWIMTIAKSRAIDQMRRRTPEPRDPQDGRADHPVDGEAEALAERWRIAALLAHLPDDECSVLRMRFYEGLTQTEIAARTGIALGTIKSRMVRGLERLRALVDAGDGGGSVDAATSLGETISPRPQGATA